jgi:hypothetical protein
MKDIVVELRELAGLCIRHPRHIRPMKRAAAEIERLRSLIASPQGERVSEASATQSAAPPKDT